MHCINRNLAGRTKKEYREEPENKTRQNKYMKEYYESNKTNLLNYQKERKNVKILCDCGSNIRRDDQLRHNRSLKHIQYVESSSIII